jgi:hypothetical protein
LGARFGAAIADEALNTIARETAGRANVLLGCAMRDLRVSDQE